MYKVYATECDRDPRLRVSSVTPPEEDIWLPLVRNVILDSQVAVGGAPKSAVNVDPLTIF